MKHIILLLMLTCAIGNASAQTFSTELLKQAESGDAASQAGLGICYFLGRGVSRDNEQAEKWLRKAAYQDEPRGYYYLGACYFTGRGVEKDYDKAAGWYMLAAKSNKGKGMLAGNAQFALGDCYSLGGPSLEADPIQAAKWYKAAAENGHPGAQNQIAAYYHYGVMGEKDEVQAVKWWTKAADQGVTEAQRRLAYAYFNGSGGLTENNSKAMELLIATATKGNVWSQYDLGEIYLGESAIDDIPQNYKEAVKWFKLSADQGNTFAQGYMGDCYYKGLGVEKNYSEAVKWYRKAATDAEFPIGSAMRQLSICYRYGRGVPQDEAIANEWSKKAAEKGNDDAKQLQKMMEKMK